ncbi:MAG TPA: hypothetical protein VK509_20860 [Polyangiales bacterium]|nr:hypothetical protein [Polyangiales bacterium]
MTRHPGGVTRCFASRSALGALGALAASALLVVVACAGCASDDDGGGAGSAPMATPGLGERCTGECTSGLVCNASGPFRSQCSAQCSGIDSCSMLAAGKMTVCLSECGLRCTGGGDCPAGTVCGAVSGQMACVSAP